MWVLALMTWRFYYFKIGGVFSTAVWNLRKRGVPKYCLWLRKCMISQAVADLSSGFMQVPFQMYEFLFLYFSWGYFHYPLSIHNRAISASVSLSGFLLVLRSLNTRGRTSLSITLWDHFKPGFVFWIWSRTNFEGHLTGPLLTTSPFKVSALTHHWTPGTESW